jgi:hypothetical protein
MDLPPVFTRWIKTQDDSLERPSRSRILDAVCVALLIAYFLYFALPARHGGFREDEMLNIWIYWKFGAFKSLLGNLMFWTTFYRPAGAFYYLPLYHFFQLNPLPYRIAQITILVALIPIAYYLARLLTSSRAVAFLTVLALCYHPGLANLVFVGAFIYDVLCGLFYLAALTYYIHFREQDVRLRPLQLLIFLALYVLALDSKEMAVTLPVIVLAYEFIRAPRLPDWAALGRWIFNCAIAPLIAGAVTAIYLSGKLYGSGSLTRLDPYRPRYSWHHFVTANAKFLGDLFFAGNALTPKALFIIWAIVWTYAFLRRDRATRLMAIWVIVVPLPLAFLVPLRGGGSLYLLLFGWAMLFAKIASDLALLISNAAVAVGQILGDAGKKIPASAIRIAVIAIVAVCLGLFTHWQNQRLDTTRALLGVGQKVDHVIAAIESLKLQPAVGSTVLLKMEEQPFQNRWHPLFIASLIWNDHSLQIWLDGLSKVAPEQLAKADYVISLSELKAKLIRSPTKPHE